MSSVAGHALQVHGLHTPRFTLDEEVLQTGAAYLASLATDFLAQHAAAAGSREEL
jgi:metal-dependent amidase/aminoacylase/carboxypeptidase family protein